MSKYVLTFLVSAFVSTCLFAADTIITDAEVFRPVKNSWASISNGDDIVYDDTANPSGAFYGIFEIKFSLDKTQYYGNVKVLIYISKNNGSWEKIAEVIPGAKPSGSETWTTRYYWNSRKAAFDWTSEDTVPFEGNMKIKLELQEQNN